MRFKFNGKISQDVRVLFILPENNLLFSYALFALRSFTDYFQKVQHIVYPVDGKVFLLNYLFKDLVYWFRFKKEKMLKKAVEAEKNLDLVINLDVENPLRYDLPFNKPYFSISKKPLRHATLNYIYLGNTPDQIYIRFPCTLGVPFQEFRLSILSDEKRKATDFIKYKGHKEKNLIVVCDVPDVKKETLIKEYLAYKTGDKITFIGREELHTINPDLIVPLISFADIFVAEDSIYVYLAQILGTKTYLFRGKGKFLPMIAPRLFIEKSDFKREILNLMPSTK
ncbi:MAG: hypothetical protein ABIM43_02690 [candidate division WOR-3 bacterium]